MNIPFSPPYIDQNVLNEVEDSLKIGLDNNRAKSKAIGRTCFLIIPMSLILYV